MTINPRSVVVVGAGHAGGSFALLLRELGATCDITVVGEEMHAPYERPSLSKEMLAGAVDTPVHLAALEQWTTLGVALRLGTKAVAIDRLGQRLVLQDGAILPYDILILATGGTARRIPGSDYAEVMTLRTVDDAVALRERAAVRRSALILGGGLIGLEAAASLRRAGLEIDLIESGPRLATRSLPAVASNWIEAAHTKAGVRLHLGSPVTTLKRMGRMVEVRLSNGKRFVSDLIVLGLGIAPNTALALSAGLACGDGILVDHDYQTLSDPRIFAIGDVAGRTRANGEQQPRDESWAHARSSAVIAARAILTLERLPEDARWFWTNQFEHIVQVAGWTGPKMTAIPRGDRVVLYLDGTTLAGIACIDAPKEFLIARRAIAAEQRVDIIRAADPAVDLRKCQLTSTDPILGRAVS